MKIAICDDNACICRELSGMIENSPDGAGAEILTFADPREMTAAAEEQGFDLLFADIMLGEEDGIAAARKVKAIRPETRVVFITAHIMQYAEDIFNGIQPYGYIGKPLRQERVDYYISRLAEELNKAERRLTVSIHGVKYCLSMQEIVYIESDRRLVHIHCGGQIHSVYERLDSIAERLDESFLRCHQSYIVNLACVQKLENGVITVKNHADSGKIIEIRVSRNRIKDARERYFEYKGRNVL